MIPFKDYLHELDAIKNTILLLDIHDNEAKKLAREMGVHPMGLEPWWYVIYGGTVESVEQYWQENIRELSREKLWV